MKSIATEVSLRSWNTHVKRTSDFFNSQSAENWSKEIAPGRNTAAYILGHLIVSSDQMIELFDLGPRKNTDLDHIFMHNPDKNGNIFPQIQILLDRWNDLHAFLDEKFSTMTDTEWLGRHTAMTDEDHQRDPLRNKLSVLVNRTLHQNYHYGQLILMKQIAK